MSGLHPYFFLSLFSHRKGEKREREAGLLALSFATRGEREKEREDRSCLLFSVLSSRGKKKNGKMEAR